MINWRRIKWSWTSCTVIKQFLFTLKPIIRLIHHLLYNWNGWVLVMRYLSLRVVSLVIAVVIRIVCTKRLLPSLFSVSLKQHYLSSLQMLWGFLQLVYYSISLRLLLIIVILLHVYNRQTLCLFHMENIWRHFNISLVIKRLQIKLKGLLCFC